MQTKLIGMIAAGVLTLAVSACGDDSSDGTETTPGTSADEDASAPSGEIVQTASTDLGEVLVDADGLTLYGFTQDTDGEPSCYDDCASAWPPLTVESEDLPDVLDPTVFRVVERADGTFQVTAGEWPLYRFAGDSSPGDVNGQGSGGAWFAVTSEGELVQEDNGEPDDADGTGTETDTRTETDTGTNGGYDY